MGYNKGRAARRAEKPSEKQIALRHDGSSVIYEASNGRTYKIDVLDMVQLNISKGTRRNVHRHQGHGKNWSMWQYEAERAEGRNYTHSKTTLVQYPKEVCIALEDRFREVRAFASLAELEGAAAVDRQRAQSAWRRKLLTFDAQRLRDVFQETVVTSRDHRDRPEEAWEDTPDKEELSAGSLAIEASEDDGLREALFEAVLRQHGSWPPSRVAEAIRWLRKKGLELGTQHVRKAALLHGGLTPLGVLLMELDPPIDLLGFEILVDHRCAVVTNGNTSGGGWVQRCKPALKALLARGAVLGSHSLQSRLLKRLEEDGMALWVDRVIASLRRHRPELPDVVLTRIGDFAAVK